MAKVSAVEIRVGNLIEWDKRVWRVLKCYHVHVGGRGGAFMQVEMKDIESGTKTNQRFRTEDKVERAFVDARDMQFLYKDESGYVFMDNKNFEQVTLDEETLGDDHYFLRDNMDVKILLFNGRGIGITLPNFVNLRITQADPWVKGDTAAGNNKPATTESGYTLAVPSFVETGDLIQIDTRTGDYVTRVKE